MDKEDVDVNKVIMKLERINNILKVIVCFYVICLLFLLVCNIYMLLTDYSHVYTIFHILSAIVFTPFELLKIRFTIYFTRMAFKYIDALQTQYALDSIKNKALILFLSFWSIVFPLSVIYKKIYVVW